VIKTSGIAPACTQSSSAGIRARLLSGTLTKSACAPPARYSLKRDHRFSRCEPPGRLIPLRLRTPNPGCLQDNPEAADNVRVVAKYRRDSVPPRELARAPDLPSAPMECLPLAHRFLNSAIRCDDDCFH
jgi:hypothetical protein